MNPLISVILPVYNQEKYIAETIESVLAQSFKDFELIILDDGSTDRSADIIRAYTNKDYRILSIFEENAGRCIATNKIVAKAKGKYCAFLDADDLMLPDRLEKQADFHLTNPEVTATSCHCYYIDARGTTVGIQRYPFLKTIEECKQVMDNKEIILCAVTGLMISTDVFIKVGGFNSKFWPSDDYEFFNRIIDEGYILVIIQEILMKYRIHASAISIKQPMQKYYRTNHVRDCLAKRRSGLSELSFEEFMILKNNEPLWKKIKERKFYYGFTLLHNAGLALYKKSYLNFSLKFIFAFLLTPKYVSAVITNRIKKR